MRWLDSHLGPGSLTDQLMTQTLKMAWLFLIRGRRHSGWQGTPHPRSASPIPWSLVPRCRVRLPLPLCAACARPRCPLPRRSGRNTC